MKRPITRSLHLAAVRKSEAPPAAASGGQRVYTFRASDGDFDRYSDRLNVKGWRVDAYNANGVVLFNHDDGTAAAWTGATPPLPIGKGRVYVEGHALMIDVEFDDEDDFAKRVERKVTKGILNAVSVRYLMLPGQYRENERGGYDCDAQELLEVSVVTIPGNARALRTKSLDGEGDDIVERIAQRVVELLAERGDDVPTDEEDTKPDAGEQPPANESKPHPGKPSSDDVPKEDDEDEDKPKNFDADEATKQFIEAFKQHIRGA
jgi:HK97 family phage prohead protease